MKPLPGRPLLTTEAPLGLQTLAIHVGEAEKTIAEVYEPFLIQKRFLVRTSRGRRATRKAVKHPRSA